ncbi:bacteriocin immunity protein [Companilactobacillus keshanensis]|uniref:Bacteriocin immunity protein n=1 Tax=Companilactobacillus keshanensis TaxID=2486003 RepID=A0ABW4BTZ6_9LACO|nr:bacteriocin immunity protein [Companilactobacillus keshanensis]
MKKSVDEQVFEIIDEMYNSLSKKADYDPEVIKTLMTAGTYLSKKKSAPQIIASKTVNGILLANAVNKSKLDQANWNRLKQLIMLAQTEGFAGSPMGPTDFRSQF